MQSTQLQHHFNQNIKEERAAFLKRPSTWAAIVSALLSGAGLVFGIWPLMKSETPTPYEISSLISSFAIAWLGNAVTAYLHQAEGIDYFSAVARSIGSNLKDHELAKVATELLTLLQINRGVFTDEWFCNKVRTLANSRSDLCNGSVHATLFYQQSLDYAIEETLRGLRGRMYWEFGREREPLRMEYLQQVVQNSHRYIQAATFDVGDYFLTFWDDNNQYFGNYLKLNQEALSRGVKVTRFFVMTREAIDGRNKEKHSRLKNIVKRHLAFAPYAEPEIVRVLCLEELPEELKGALSSFLICDDEFVSMSYCGGEVEPKTGFVAVRDREYLALLKHRSSLLGAMKDYTIELTKRK